MKEAIANPEEVKVLFVDEASFYRQPTQGWLWSWIGRFQPKLPYSHHANTVMRVVGFLEATQAQVHAWDFSRVTVQRFVQCLKRISAAYPQAKKLYLVMDNWPVHRHPFTQQAAAADERIHVLFLPTYAPWLNNIEKLWRWMKHYVVHAHPWCDDFLQFRETIRHELLRLGPGSTELRHYCGLDKIISI